MTYNVVSVPSQFPHAVHTAPSVRGPVVGGEEAEDVGQGDLVLDDLIVLLLRGDGFHVLVAPGVASNLVSFVKHSPERVWLPGAGLVDGPLGPVYTGDEEGGAGSILAQNIEKLVGVAPWTVVKRKGHGTGDGAGLEVGAVWDIAEMGSRSLGGIGSIGKDVPVARRTVAELAPWSCAVFSPGSAKTLPTRVSIEGARAKGTEYERQRSSKSRHHNSLRQGRTEPSSEPSSNSFGPWRLNGEVRLGQCWQQQFRPTPEGCWKYRAEACWNRFG